MSTAKPVRAYTQEDVADIQGLLFQLTKSRKRAKLVSSERLKDVIEGRAHIATIRESATDRIIGMGTLAVIDLLMDRKAIIEDVVVHREHRGKGLGTRVIGLLIAKARELGVSHIDLTSRSERVEAKRLYRSTGFGKRDTNVYRLHLSRNTS